MQCPKCQGAMYPVRVEAYEVERCGTCEGLWFDLRQHEHLREIRDSAAHIDCAPPEKGRLYDKIRDYPCPACSGPMVKLSIPEQPHIHVEQCAICGGVFFDAGEFTDYQRFTLGERVSLFLSTFKSRRTRSAKPR